MLKKNPRFPNNPSKTQTLTTFDTPANRADNYGARVITYYQVIVIIVPYIEPSSGGIN